MIIVHCSRLIYIIKQSNGRCMSLLLCVFVTETSLVQKCEQIPFKLWQVWNIAYSKYGNRYVLAVKAVLPAIFMNKFQNCFLIDIKMYKFKFWQVKIRKAVWVQISNNVFFPFLF